MSSSSQRQSQSRQDLISMELCGASATVCMTHGAISIWLGRNAGESLVNRVMKTIARVDYAAEHEREIICEFEEISEFEGNGYVLTSYARKGSRYRAIFVVPFSEESALDLFVGSIINDLNRGDLRLTLRWRGGALRMRSLCEELKRLDYFSSVQPTYRSEPQ